MKSAIYNPYLETMGGGERYSLSFGQVLVKLGYKVDVEWKDPSILKRLSKRFGLDLTGINIVNDIRRGDGYDVCFWVSDGSIPTLKARNNFLHFQAPFVNVGGSTLINKMKLFRINKVICNSEFTKSYIDKEFGVKSVVIYPPIEIVNSLKNKTKENTILYVGRFSQLLQSKNQDVLIDVFKKLLRNKIGKWKLILAGGVEVGVGNYIKILQKKSKGMPIEIIESPSFEKIKSLYSKAKIYWSAAGYGINDLKNPIKVEHFGMTVVESMSYGSIPVIYNAGGHKEIINDGENGFLWKTKKELIEKTLKIIKNQVDTHKISQKSRIDSSKFGTDTFFSSVKNIF